MTANQVITRAQWRELDPLPPARELLPGVFLLGEVDPTWRQRLEAALLWAGEEAAIAGPTAAEVWGLSGFSGAPIHLAVPGSPKLSPKALVALKLYRCRKLEHWDVELRGGLCVTRIERVLFDLAGYLHPSKLERMVDEALRKSLTKPQRLRACFKRLERQGRRGVAAMRALFERRGYSLRHLRSLTEDHFARLFHAQGLPEPQADYAVGGGRQSRYYLDFAYPPLLLGIEIDTWEHHSSEVDWAADQTRLNDLVSWGWSIMRFTNYDLPDPTRVAALVREALRVRERALVTARPSP